MTKHPSEEVKGLIISHGEKSHPSNEECDFCKKVKEEWKLTKELLAQAHSQGVSEERAKIVTETKSWLKTHFPDKDGAFNIQNLLGNILGWGTKEQEEISNLLKDK